MLKVDCVVRKDSEYRREELRQRRRVTLGELEAFLVAPEDLIISKLDWVRDRPGRLGRAESAAEGPGELG